jgi:hypothetical protein
VAPVGLVVFQELFVVLEVLSALDGHVLLEVLASVVALVVEASGGAGNV